MRATFSDVVDRALFNSHRFAAGGARHGSEARHHYSLSKGLAGQVQAYGRTFNHTSNSTARHFRDSGHNSRRRVRRPNLQRERSLPLPGQSVEVPTNEDHNHDPKQQADKFAHRPTSKAISRCFQYYKRSRRDTALNHLGCPLSSHDGNFLPTLSGLSARLLFGRTGGTFWGIAVVLAGLVRGGIARLEWRNASLQFAGTALHKQS